MWQNPQESADLVKFTEESLNGKEKGTQNEKSKEKEQALRIVWRRSKTSKLLSRSKFTVLFVSRS